MDDSIEIVEGGHWSRTVDLGRFRVSEARFSGRLRLDKHTHPRACVSLVLDGGFLQQFPGRDCRCGVGGVIAKPPEETHRDRWFDRPSHHLMVEPHPEHYDLLGPARTLVEEVWVPPPDPGALAFGRMILREVALADDLSRLGTEGLILSWFAHLLRRPPSEGGRTPPDWLVRVRDRLHDEFLHAPSLDDLAADAGVHPSHLSRTFARFYGVPPSDYQRRLRLDRARRLLEETAMPLARVAAASGFCDQSHLNRVMKRELGLTPGRYRAVWRGRRSGR